MMNSMHMTCPLRYDDETVWIDSQIVYQIRELWAAGIRTRASCQGGGRVSWHDEQGRPEAYAMVGDWRAMDVIPDSYVTHGPRYFKGPWWLLRWPA